MVTALFSLLEKEDSGEIWYFGGKREHTFNNQLIERWIPNFSNYKTDFTPDVIFSRGGFKNYHSVLQKFPKSVKIYYGAGARYLPQEGFKNYDLILQDSQKQLDKCRKLYPHIKSSLFIKPAPDNLFYPLEGIKKEFDIAFPANGSQKQLKGHSFVYSTVPKHLKVLNLGNRSGITAPSNVTRKRVLRTQMNEQLQRCRVGIVTCSSSKDSCPRVIPEMLASGIPIVVLDTTRFWIEKYITPETGIVSDKEHFWENIQYVLDNLDQFNPRKYYEENLTLKHAAKFIKNLI